MLKAKVITCNIRVSVNTTKTVVNGGCVWLFYLSLYLACGFIRLWSFVIGVACDVGYVGGVTKCDLKPITFYDINYMKERRNKDYLFIILVKSLLYTETNAIYSPTDFYN